MLLGDLRRIDGDLKEVRAELIGHRDFDAHFAEVIFDLDAAVGLGECEPDLRGVARTHVGGRSVLDLRRSQHHRGADLAAEHLGRDGVAARIDRGAPPDIAVLLVDQREHILDLFVIALADLGFIGRPEFEIVVLGDLLQFLKDICFRAVHPRLCLVICGDRGFGGGLRRCAVTCILAVGKRGHRPEHGREHQSGSEHAAHNILSFLHDSHRLTLSRDTGSLYTANRRKHRPSGRGSGTAPPERG